MHTPFAPVASWLPRYFQGPASTWKGRVARDAIAGATIGAMVVPQSLSYAAVAGVPPAHGLYADLQVVYPFLGTSPYLVIGPVAVMSLMVRATAEQAGGGVLMEGSVEWGRYAAFLALLVGLFQILMGVFRVGSKVAKHVSHTIIAAFTASAGILICSTQLSSVLGLKACKVASEIPGGRPTSCSFASKIFHALTLSGGGDAKTAFIGFNSIAFLLFARSSFLKELLGPQRAYLTRMGSLAIIAAGIAYAWMTGSCAEQGGSLSCVGYLPPGLPGFYFPVPPIPVVGFWQLVGILRAIVPLSFIGYAEALAIAKSAQARYASRELVAGNLQNAAFPSGDVDEDQELVALGACNVWSSLFQGFTVTGSFSRTAINADSGAMSPISVLFAAGVVVLTLLVLTPVMSLLPKAVVSAVVIVAISRLIDPEEFAKLYRTGDRHGCAVYLSTFLATLAFGVDAGLCLGIAVDSIEKVRRSLRQFMTKRISRALSRQFSSGSLSA